MPLERIQFQAEVLEPSRECQCRIFLQWQVNVGFIVGSNKNGGWKRSQVMQSFEISSKRFGHFALCIVDIF